MSDYPYLNQPTSGSQYSFVYGNPRSSGSIGAKLTTGGANTFGSWTTVMTNTVLSGGAIVVLTGNSAASSYAVQLQVNHTAGSSALVVDKLMFQAPRAVQGGYAYYLPISFPSSGSITARASATNSTVDIRVAMSLLPASVSGNYTFQNSFAMGFAAGDGASGTQVDPGATLWTKGAVSVLHPSTPFPIRYLIVMVGLRANTAASSCCMRLDIMAGGAGAEYAIIPDIVIQANTTNDDIDPHVIGIPIFIPAGTRLSARSMCDISDATDRLIDVALLGFY